VSGGHHGSATVDSLHGGVESPVAALDEVVKLVAVLVFVLAVVLTPPHAVWAFGWYLGVIGSVVVLARLPVRVFARRLLVETPFVLFAVALPFIGTGPRTEVFGVSISTAGAWAAWGILAKATLGCAATVVLAWSTPVPDVLRGLERLRVPKLLVAIAGFMVRYLDVVMGELHRLQIARVSRGDDARWLWQGRAVAATAGTMFVRSFERGERVQQAMLSRGFDGTFPRTGRSVAPMRWWPAALWPASAVLVAAAANVVAR
jgi:cobalt/nickel transport system permease protein